MIVVNWKPQATDLRQFGLIGLGFSAVIGAGAWHWYEAHTLAVILWSLGTVVAAVGCVRPSAIRPVYIGLTLATYPIGWTVSHLTMAVMYYGILTPLGLLFRVIGRDPLERRFDRDAQTYWRACAPANHVRTYFTQC